MKGLFGENINSKFQFSFGLNFNNKFENDKIFHESSNEILGFDGVVLNKTNLVKNNTEWVDFFINPKNKLENQLNKLRGVFHGFIFNKKSQELILFNDPTGNKNFSFYCHQKHFAFYPDDYSLISSLKEQNICLELSPKAVYAFLAYGYLTSETSWIEFGKRLNAGTILRYKDGKITTSQYKNFISNPISSASKSQLLNDFEELFRNSVILQYNKDIENNYRHFATLSGGLDSRATILMANELGYKNQTTFTCSQSNYSDEKIAKEIATYYSFKHLFHPLDTFEHLFEIDSMNKKIGGTANYSGPAHVIFGIEKFWVNSFGLIHTGHIGDGVMGTFLSSKNMIAPDLKFRRASENILPRISEFDNQISNKYSCEETFKLYEIGFNSVASGVWGLEQLSYNISPFIDIDILDFLQTIPYDLKHNRKLYIDWFLKKHPEWTRFKLESIQSKPNAFWKIKYAQTYMRLRFGWKKLLFPDFKHKFQMTPEQYWFQNSKELQTYYTSEFSKSMSILETLNFPFSKEIELFFNSKNYSNHSKALHISNIINLIYNQD